VGAVTVDRLSFRYQPAAGEVLKNISFTVEKGEIVALLGLSGCGKSTICQCLGGIIPHLLGLTQFQCIGCRKLRTPLT
jgi:energy-coupling factor transport system ATP-binding protein